jgi:hypothetical protein
MGKKKAPAEATARPELATSHLKPEDIVSVTAQHAGTIKSAPGYANSPDVQKALTNWTGAANAVNTGISAITAARLALAALLATQLTDVAAWKRATTALLAAISTAAGGSAQALAQWGFAPATRVAPTPTDAPPAKLRATYTKALVLVLRWAAVRNNRGYFVQIGDGTPQGWGAAIPCTKVAYAPTGVAPGQKIAVRVAVQRKTGLSSWSDPLTITVR